jgi:vitamin B12 transporter
LLPVLTFAQNIDSLRSYTAPVVEFVAPRLANFDIDNQILEPTAQTQGANLPQILLMQSNFFVKQYGLGGLSTLSHRGGTAAQTQIFWEGINIQNPMLGQTDLSLIPLFFIDQIELQTHAASALVGSSAAGGNIHLSSKDLRKETQNIKLFYNIAQFGQHRIGAEISYGNKKRQSWAGRSRFWHLRAKNDFVYRDVNAFGFPKPLRNMPHNRAQQWGGQQELSFNFRAEQQIQLKAWWQYAERQLPPTLLQSSNDEQQIDQSLRLLAQYQRKNSLRKSQFQVRQAFIRERLDFWSAAVDSRSVFYNIQTEANFSKQYAAAHLTEISLQYNYLQAQTNGGYAQIPHQHRFNLAAFSKYQPPQKALIITALARLEQVFPNYTLSAFSAAAAYRISAKFRINLQLSQNYRLPTFNDWYWHVGGNPQLKPEKTQLADINIHFQTPINPHFSFSSKVNLYYAHTRQQIVWLPDPNTNLWAVFNLDRTHSRGVHLQATAQYKKSDRYQLAATAQYTFSRINDAQTPDNQLIYSPKHNYTADFRADFRNKLTFVYQQIATSSRYLDNTNINTLPAYTTANIFVAYQQPFGQTKAKIGLNIYNIYNVDYQVVANRPMPRRWAELTFSFVW